jgi:Tfp pilus assembly major pilin PilA
LSSPFHYFRAGKVYEKMIERNKSVNGLTKEKWVNKPIEDCIADETDPECNFVAGTKADLSMV